MKSLKFKTMDIKLLKDVVANLGNEFDSHKFIEKFISLHEKEYVDLLHKKEKGIFRAAHSYIGKCLSNNSLKLKIEKTERVVSENIKKYDCENQNWKKI